MAESRTARLAGLGCAALAVAACGTTPNLPTQMNRPAASALGAPSDTLTHHNDSARTGAALSETRLSPASIVQGQFERLFDWKVDGQIYTQPLYVAQVPFQGPTCANPPAQAAGPINLVVVATMNNSVYAFEAPPADSDVQPCTKPLWQVGRDQLGRPLPFDFFIIDWGVLGHNIKPLIGITATPVIDRQRGLVYVTVKTGYSALWGLVSRTDYRLVAIDLLTGKLVAATDITATHPAGPGTQAAELDAKHHLQRPALLEANDRIYVAFGSHQDTKPYHGWLLSYDASTLKPLDAYCTTCGRVVADDCSDGSCQGGIWQAGAGPAADEQGHLYVMTGNGSFDGRADLSTSFIKLDRDLHVLGSWTPAEWGCLNRIDADLGSAGPTYLAGPSVLVGGGKEGLLYALDARALSGNRVQSGSLKKSDPCTDAYDRVPDATGPGFWSIQAAPTWNEDGFMDLVRIVDDSVAAQGFHHIHGAPVQWTVRDHDRERVLLYVSAERDQLRAYEFDRDRGFVGASAPGESPKDAFHSRCRNSDTGMPGGFLTLSANGDDPASGIVWAAMPRRNQDALNNTVRGVLRAYRAWPDGGDELKEIWNSDSGTSVQAAQDCGDRPRAGAGSPDALGDFAKFAPPTVAEGKVYVSTFSHRLVVYGLAQPGEARAEGQAPPYDARLELGRMPASVEPGSAFEVSIVATNTGSKAWTAQDDIHLGSPTIPGDPGADSEADAPKVTSDVPPGGTYTFDLKLKAGPLEERRDFSWRMVRLGGTPKPRQPSGQWFGAPTAEATLVALRDACGELRQRARDLHERALAVRARLRNEPTEDDRSAARSLNDDIEALKQDAASAKCSLRAGIDAAMGHR
jgi:hypothetical protein